MSDENERKLIQQSSDDVRELHTPQEKALDDSNKGAKKEEE